MKYILTDVEGTTTSIQFVHKVLFPYAAKRMDSFLVEHRLDSEVQRALTLVEQTIHEEKLDLSANAALKQWIENDRKHPGLKALQGLIWQFGYEQGEIKGHVYEDVPAALIRFRDQGYDLGVYSSGSVLAQKLLFKFSVAGDLDRYFSHNFDTGIGHKRELQSYTNIANNLNIPAGEILFLSDVPEELVAAQGAGMQVLQLCREGLVADSKFDSVTDFSQIS